MKIALFTLFISLNAAVAENAVPIDATHIEAIENQNLTVENGQMWILENYNPGFIAMDPFSKDPEISKRSVPAFADTKISHHVSHECYMVLSPAPDFVKNGVYAIDPVGESKWQAGKFKQGISIEPDTNGRFGVSSLQCFDWIKVPYKFRPACVEQTSMRSAYFAPGHITLTRLESPVANQTLTIYSYTSGQALRCIEKINFMVLKKSEGEG